MKHVATHARRTPFFSFLLITLASIAVAACGEAPDRASAPETIAIPIAMTDFAFEPMSVTVPVGKRVRLDFSNTGSVVHEFMVGETFRAEGEGFDMDPFDGVTVVRMMSGEVVRETNAEGGHAHHGTHIELEPGETGSLTFTLPETKAGTYKMGCFKTTQGVQHFQRGMRGTFVVAMSDMPPNSM